MQYTELRGSIYWFRRRAPKPLQPGMQCILGDRDAVVGKNGYVRLTLNTSDRREAAKLSRKLSHFLDLAAERAEKLQQQPHSRSLQTKPTPEEIQHAADSMYAMLLAADDGAAIRSTESLLKGEDTAEIREPDRFLWSSADLPGLSSMGQVELLKKGAPMFSFFLHITTGKTISEATPDLLPFVDAFRRYISALEKRKVSEFVPTPVLPSANNLWSWKDALEYYQQQRPGLSEGTKASYRLAWETLEKSAKCQPAKLTTKAVVAWRDDMLKKLDPKTAKDRLTAAKAIWRESRVNEKIDRATIDPFEGLRVKTDATAGSSREEFTRQELVKIYSAPPLQTARAVSIEAGYWLPLLALYHGARLEELTGLEVVDIENWDGGMLIHIRRNSIRPNLKHGKKSERSFPVHPTVAQLGFGSYVIAAREAGVVALFPSFASGATFGEAYVGYVKELVLPKPGRLVGMHCFRHNWETARRNSTLDTSVSNYITGRRIDAGSAAIYGSPAGLKTLYSELAKIDYGLNHLPAPTVTSETLKAQDLRRIRAMRRTVKSSN